MPEARRAFAGRLAAGGAPGAIGLNTLRRADGREEVLGGLVELAAEPGDRLTIESPGGGGWGRGRGRG